MKKVSNPSAQANRITKAKAANAAAADDAAKIAAEALVIPSPKAAQAGLPGISASAKPARGVWKDDEDDLGLEAQAADELAYETSGGDASAGLASAADADMVAQAAAAVATDAAASGAAAGASSTGAAAGSAGAAGAAAGTAGAVGAAAAAAAAIGPGTILAGLLVGGAVIGGLGGSSNAPAATAQPTPLTAAVTIDKTALKAGETATVTIRFNKAVTGLSLDDLTVSVGAGTLSDLSAPVIGADGSATYTVKFIPAADAELTDNLITLKGQAVLDAANLANESASVSQKFSVDTKRPTATIAIDDTALAIGQTAQITITFSEKPTGFDPAVDLTVAGGTLSGGAFDTATGKIYRATFTPTEKIEDATNVIQLSKDWTDAAGNAPAVASASANYAIDTKAPGLTGKSIDRAAGVITLDFDEALALSITDGVVDPQQFTVEAINAESLSSVKVAVQSVRVEGNKLILSMANALTETVDEMVSFTRGTSGALINDSAGNALESFSPLRVSDGLIRDAKVLIEFTQNGVTKIEDTGLVTNDQGDFFLPASFTKGQYSNGTLIIRGGINIDTGIPNALDMRVPLGVSAVTPFTALTEAVDRYLKGLFQPAASLDAADAEVLASLRAVGVESAASLTAGFSKSLMATAFGLPAGADVSKITPQSFSSLPTPPAAVVLLQKVATQIVAISSEGIKSDGQDGAAAVLEGLAKQIVVSGVAGQTLDLANPGVLQNAYQGLSVAAESVAAVADASKAISVAANTGGLGGITAAQSQYFDTKVPNAPTGIEVRGLSAGSTTIGSGKPTVKVTLDTQSEQGGAAVVGDTVVLLNGGVQVGKKLISAADLTAGFVDLQPEYDIRDGVVSFSAQVVDRAGNSSPAPGAGSAVPVAQVQIFTGVTTPIDTTAPVAPTIDVIAGDNKINAAERAANSGVTLSGTAENNATVLVSWGSGGTARQASLKADASGNWSYPLTAADYRSLGVEAVISAVAVDAAGNRSPASAPITLQVDTVNPLLSAIELANAQLAGVGLPATADQTPELRFSAEAGARLEFDWDNDGSYDDQTIASVAGLAGSIATVRESAPIGLDEGPRTVRVKATDGALNVTERTVEFVVDKTAPAAGVISVDALDSRKMTIRFTEPVSASLSINDLSVANEPAAFGTGATLVPLDAAAGRARSFLLTLGAGESIDTNDVIKVTAAKAGDWLGNVPLSDISFTVPVVDSTAPAILGTPAIVKEKFPTESVGTLGPGQAALIKITFNEPVTGFGADDLELAPVGGASAGQLGAVTRIDASNYQVTYIPAIGIDGSVGISMKANGFTDLSGNRNAAGAIGSVAVDTKAATLTISSNDSALKQNETATLTFTFSEPFAGLTSLTASQVQERVKLSGEADISTFTEVSGSGGKIFTAVVTPKAAAAGVIDVGLEGWKDDAGNPVSVLSRPKIAFDTVPPAAPALTAAALTDTWLNDAEATTGLSVRVALNGTGLAAPVAGDKVELSQGGAVVASATLTSADAQAKFVDFKLNKTALGQDGSKSLTAKVTDVAGNESALSSELSFTLDTVAPQIADPSPALSIPENSLAPLASLKNVPVGEQLPVTWSFVDASTSLFSIDSVTTDLKPKVAFDYEALTGDKTVLLAVRATDAAGNVKTKEVRVAVTDVNEAPTAVTLSGAVTSRPEAEGNTPTASRVKLADIVIADDALGTNTVELKGTEAGKFEIVDRALYLKAGQVLDFEKATSHSVDVEVKDATVSGSSAVKTTYTLAVTPVNEAPVAASMAAQIAVVSQLYTLNLANFFSDVDAGDSLTYSVNGQLPGGLSLSGGVVRGYATGDAAARPVTIRATDSGGRYAETTVDFSAVSAPSVVELKVEDSVGSKVAGKAGDSLEVTLRLSEGISLSSNSGTPSPSIQLQFGSGSTVTATYLSSSSNLATGVLKFSAAAPTDDASVVTLKAISLGTGTTATGLVSFQPWQTAAVNQTDSYRLDNTPPQIPTPSPGLYIAENSSAELLRLSSVNLGEEVSWSFVDAEASLFNYNPSTTALTPKSAFDYEALPANNKTVLLAVRATDLAGHEATKDILVTVTDVNEAPTAVSLGSGATVALPENTPTTSRVKLADVLIADDALGTNTVELKGTTAGKFEVVGGALYLKAGETLNFETASSHPLTIEVSDTTIAGTPVVRSVAYQLAVTDVNEPPTVASLGNQIAVVGQPYTLTLSNYFSDVDAADQSGLTYQLTGSLPIGLTVQAGVISGSATQDTQSPMAVTIRATDKQGEYVERTINFSAVSAPSVVGLKVEDSVGSKTAGKVGDSLEVTLTLSEGISLTSTSGSPSPTIQLQFGSGSTVTTTYQSSSDPANKVLKFAATAPAGDASVVTLKAISLGSGTTATGLVSGQPWQTAAIDQTDSYRLDNTVPQIPIPSSGLSIAENSTAELLRLSSLNLGELVSWSFVNPSTSLFNYDPVTTALTPKSAFDYEALSDAKTVSLAVRATDLAGNVTDNTLSIAVTNVYEPPVLGGNGTVAVNENATGVVFDANPVVTDMGRAVTFSLSGPDQARFAISSSGVVTFVQSPNFEAPLDVGADNVYNFTVNASDGTSTGTKDVVVTVANLPEAPRFASTSVEINLPENTAAVGNAAATDPDAGDAVTYSLSGANASALNINPATGALSFKSSPNYELDAKTYNVVVTATDKGNLTATQAITINITDVPEKVEFRKGPVTSDLVTLELWVDADFPIGALDLSFKLADPTKFKIDSVPTEDGLGFALDPAVLKWVSTTWLGDGKEESPGSGVYNLGAFSGTGLVDGATFQKLVSFDIDRIQASDSLAVSLLSAGLDASSGAGTFSLSTPIDYIFSLV